MTEFIIRDMAFGSLLGEPFRSAQGFYWHGTSDWCAMAPADGLEYRPGSIVLQRVYEIGDTSEGEGSDLVTGAPEYDEANDRVVRHTVRSKSADDISREQTKWVRDRREGYKAAVLTGKGYPQGSEIDGLGFVADMICSELQAIRNGDAMTDEFAAFLTARSAVKQANPKP